ncbi:MAG: cytochrome C [Desulfobacteraceae bacterium]|nr:MAG: cytochrome C [Desulfobacteraceae bacterium]
MERRKERLLAYVIVIVLFLVGVVSYAAYPDRKPGEPPRVMLRNTAGGVLLDHKAHADTSRAGYGISCVDCHHNMVEGSADPDEKPQSCKNCHTPEGEGGTKSSDAFHLLCKGCHEDGGIGPVQCSGCHMM